jgi:hypothetical protein
MEIEDIYIDEAGNTGQDLLNEDQKAFVLASNNFSNEQLLELSKALPKSDELHFVALKGSRNGRESLLKFLNHPLISEENIQCFAAHKEFVASIHIVDRLIEPVMYDVGIDIYRYAENINMSNVIFYFGKSGIWNSELFDTMLTSFMQMMRKKTSETIETFYSDAENLLRTIPSSDKTLMKLVMESRNQITSILESIDKFSLDVTLSGFYVICDLWHKRTGKRLRVFQDDSKQISHFREYIDFTVKIPMDKQEIGFDSRKMTFPSQIEELQMVSSENILGVQISDLIASSIAFMYSNKNPKHNELVNSIKASRLLNLTNNHTLWPSTIEQFEKIQRDGKGQNPLDFLATQLLKSRRQKGLLDKIIL